MDLRTYLSILNRQRVVIIGTLLFALLAAFAGTFLLTPKYQAAATLRFSTAICAIQHRLYRPSDEHLQ